MAAYFSDSTASSLGSQQKPSARTSGQNVASAVVETARSGPYRHNGCASPGGGRERMRAADDAAKDAIFVAGLRAMVCRLVTCSCSCSCRKPAVGLERVLGV